MLVAPDLHSLNPFQRLDSLPLPELNPFSMDVDPPPAKRARARYIFQRCLLPSQDSTDRMGEVLAPDSDTEDPC